jgi:trimethylamine--corrinoid protein Co-methyltransferase
VEDGHVQVMSGGASVRVHTLDGQYADATWEHLRQFNILLDALPNIHVLLNQVDPPGAGGANYYRRIAAEMFLHSIKPFCLQAGGAADVEAFVEMAAVIRGSSAAVVRQPLFMTGANAEPPLVIPEYAAEIIMAAGAAGVPCGIGDYLMLGLTGPLTVAGALVQRNAVQLTALALSQFSHPGAPFYYVASSGALNMKTLEPRMANPAALQLLRASVQLGRSYRLPLCGLAITDARMPDGQAACERTATFLAALEGGAHIIQGPTSMMDQMMLSSFAQVVIDNDLAGYLLAARAAPGCSPDELALDTIHEVVNDSALGDFKFAAHPDTVARLQDQNWQPLVFDHGGFEAWQKVGRPALVARATAVAREMITRPAPGPLDSGAAAEIMRIAGAEVPGKSS